MFDATETAGLAKAVGRLTIALGQIEAQLEAVAKERDDFRIELQELKEKDASSSPKE